VGEEEPCTIESKSVTKTSLKTLNPTCGGRGSGNVKCEGGKRGEGEKEKVVDERGVEEVAERGYERKGRKMKVGGG